MVLQYLLPPRVNVILRNKIGTQISHNAWR